MKLIDYIFWHYYCLGERIKKTKNGDSVFFAITLMFYSSITTLVILLITIDVFVCDWKSLLGIRDVSQYEAKLCILTFVLPFVFYLFYRYRKQKSIITGKYKMFRERWGEPSQISKKKMIVLVVYTIVSIVGMVVYAIVMGHLNRQGVFDAYRLFP